MTTDDQWKIADGWLSGARQVLSPNCNSRPSGAVPELIVVHGISLPPGQYGGSDIEALFTNTLDPNAHPYFAEIAGLEVSAHFDRGAGMACRCLVLGRAGAVQ